MSATDQSLTFTDYKVNVSQGTGLIHFQKLTAPVATFAELSWISLNEVDASGVNVLGRTFNFDSSSFTVSSSSADNTITMTANFQVANNPVNFSCTAQYIAADTVGTDIVGNCVVIPAKSLKLSFNISNWPQVLTQGNQLQLTTSLQSSNSTGTIDASDPQTIQLPNVGILFSLSGILRDSAFVDVICAPKVTVNQNTAQIAWTFPWSTSVIYDPVLVVNDQTANLPASLVPQLTGGNLFILVLTAALFASSFWLLWS